MSELKTETMVVDDVNVVRKIPDTLKNFNYQDKTGIDLYELERNRNNVTIPQKKDVDLSYDRTISRKTGPYQIAIKAERQALIEDLHRMRNDINAAARDKSLTLLNSDIDMIKFIPNARFAYYNRLIRDSIAQGKASEDDIRFVDTIWMNDDAKEAVKKILRLNLDPELKTFTVRPTPSRSNVQYYDDPRESRLALKLSNPGTVLFPTTFIEDNRDSTDMTLGERILLTLDKKLQQLTDEIQLTRDLDPLIGQLSTSDELTKSLLWMREKLLDRHLRYKDLVKMAEQMQYLIGLKRSRYLLTLMDPFKHKTARVPTLINPPSAVFSVRSIVPLTTNASGNVAFAFNPFHLAPSGSVATAFSVNNNAALDGTGPSNFFLGVDVGQALPADFYVRYRLVSAGLRVYCYPSSNNDNGLLTVAVTFETISTSNIGAANANAQQWGAFAQIENGYFKETTTIASRTVQQHSYIPIDESMWDYQALSSVKNGFGWVGYITGATPSTAIARVEVIMNFEALLDNQYTDYLPSDSIPVDQDPKMIFAAIGSIKSDTSSAITPKKIEEVLEEQNMSIQPDSEITLPPSKTVTDIKDKAGSFASNVLREVAATVLDSLPNTKKGNFLTSVMNALSPLASSIIQSAASKMFLPFGIGGAKF